MTSFSSRDHPPLPLEDPRWQQYEGGYRLPYDASAALKRLMTEGPSALLWMELWQQLHHQGDVGSASYAAVPHLLAWAQQAATLDWNTLSLVATIELARPNNPCPPEELEAGYFEAIRAIPNWIGSHPDKAWDQLLTRAIVSCIALAKGHRTLAEAYLEMDEHEAGVFLDR